MNQAPLWLLDTNIISKAIREPIPTRARLLSHRMASLAISTVTIAELECGSLKAPDSTRNRARWRAAVIDYHLLPFDDQAAVIHARLRLTLRHQPIGERDLLIASIALANHLGVVTNNTAEFRRIPGLRCEDWTKGSAR